MTDAAKLKLLAAEVKRCHTILEIDHTFSFQNGRLERVEIPFKDRAREPDLIARLNAQIKRDEMEIERLKGVVSNLFAKLRGKKPVAAQPAANPTPVVSPALGPAPTNIAEALVNAMAAEQSAEKPSVAPKKRTARK